MQVSNLNRLRADSNPVQATTLNRLAAWSLLTVGSVVLSLAYTCALPFAALAFFAALKLKRRDAWLAIGSVWLLNQAVGFGCLNYPHTASCFTWGVAIGAAAYSALGIAMWVRNRSQVSNALVTSVLALVAAFATFKVLILIVGYGLNGRFEFSWSNLAEMLAINICPFAAINAVLLLATRVRSRQPFYLVPTPGMHPAVPSINE